ncbi:MAG: hypothetical protein KBS62_07520 [Oscillospiraceae bacterium]|nr:hypothetical protein [Candidatus Ruminococcus equi]
MITIQSGKMNIPERERYIGFAGDNNVSQKQFHILDISDETFIYRLYLTFDDGTCNYFLLEKSVGESSTTLTWNILEEHIFKSGVVKAQIKAISSDGEIYHTGSDYFIVLPSAEYTEYFANKENSEFLRYERFLNTILDNIEITQQSLPYIGDDGYWYIYDVDEGRYIKTDFTACCDDERHIIRVDGEMSDTSDNPVKNKTVKAYVDSTRSHLVEDTRKIANIPLSSDITASGLRSALGVRPDFDGHGAPTESTNYQTNDTYLNTDTSDLYVYNASFPAGSKWRKITGVPYTAGDGINIANGEISVEDEIIEGAQLGSTSVQLTGEQSIYGQKIFYSTNNPSEYCSFVDSAPTNLGGGVRFSQSGSSYYITPKGASLHNAQNEIDIYFPLSKPNGTYTVATLDDLLTFASTVPTASTKGFKGEIKWIYTLGRLFICVGSNDETYTWKELPTSDAITTLLQNYVSTSKVKSAYSSTAGDVYDATYINSVVGNVETALDEIRGVSV